MFGYHRKEIKGKSKLCFRVGTRVVIDPREDSKYINLKGKIGTVVGSLLRSPIKGVRINRDTILFISKKELL